MKFEPQDKIFIVGGGEPPEDTGPPAVVRASANAAEMGGRKGYCDPYKMLQPAMVIVDRSGKILYWWSWAKLQPGNVYPGGPEKDPFTKMFEAPPYPGSSRARPEFFAGQEGSAYRYVPNSLTPQNPTGNTHDVRWKPMPADILRALKANTPDDILVDNIGFPAGRMRTLEDHKNAIGLNPNASYAAQMVPQKPAAAKL